MIVVKMSVDPASAYTGWVGSVTKAGVLVYGGAGERRPTVVVRRGLGFVEGSP